MIIFYGTFPTILISAYLIIYIALFIFFCFTIQDNWFSSLNSLTLFFGLYFFHGQYHTGRSFAFNHRSYVIYIVLTLYYTDISWFFYQRCLISSPLTIFHSCIVLFAIPPLSCPLSTLSFLLKILLIAHFFSGFSSCALLIGQDKAQRTLGNAPPLPRLSLWTFDRCLPLRSVFDQFSLMIFFPCCTTSCAFIHATVVVSTFTHKTFWLLFTTSLSFTFNYYNSLGRRSRVAANTQMQWTMGQELKPSRCRLTIFSHRRVADDHPREVSQLCHERISQREHSGASWVG